MRSCIFFRESLLLRLRFSHLRQGQIQGTLRLLVNADHLVDEGRIIQSVQHVLLIQQTDLQLTVVDKGNAVVLQLLSVSFDVREQLIDSYPSQTEASTTGILRIVLSDSLRLLKVGIHLLLSHINPNHDDPIKHATLLEWNSYYL